MKIALVHPYTWPEVRRGGERYLDDLLGYLGRAGHRVDLIVGDHHRSSVEVTARGADVRLRHLPTLRRGRLRVTPVESFGFRAAPALMRSRYDVVHSLVPGAALAARAARQRGVFTLLGYPSRDLLEGHPVKRRVLSAAMHASAAVTVLSSTVARSVEEDFGCKTVVLPPGVRTSVFAPTARSTTPTILFASAMRAEKGLDVLLQAFAIVAASHADVRLVLCGPGDASWAFAVAGEAIAPYRDRVDVVGPGSPGELPARYAAAHVTALPSRNEAFGLVLAESLASGTPVVGCVGGGADDIVTEDVGAIVPHGDATALAEALATTLRLALDPATPARCVQRARTWDWDANIGPEHEALYRAVSGS